MSEHRRAAIKCQALSLLILATSLFSYGSNSAKGAILLPSPLDPALNRKFGDFTVFSLPFLENLFGPPFGVKSTPGAIKDGVVIMTGASGKPVNENVDGIDNAYPTPSGNGSLKHFDTAAVTDPSGGDPSPDLDPSWDADVSALRDFLAVMGGELVIYFNLNDTNSSGLGGQDLLAWAQFDLIHGTDSSLDKTFFVSAADDPLTMGPGMDERVIGLADSMAFGAPDETDLSVGETTPPIDSRWATAHGEISVGPAGEFLHFGPLVVGDPAGSSVINQNLGADEAAFAIFNEELNDLVKDPLSGYTSLQARILLSRIDNGYEQAFIHPMTNFTDGPPVGNVIPEPAGVVTWTLLSLCCGFGYRFRRKSQNC